MKKIISGIMVFSLMLSISLTAFASPPMDITALFASSESKMVEVSISDELRNSITCGVRHEDGTTTVLNPEIKLERVVSNQRSSNNEDLYVLSVHQTYSSLENDSDYDESKMCDASVFVQMVYKVNSGTSPNMLQEVHVRYAGASNVQIFNREVEYGTKAVDMRTARPGMTFDKANLNMYSDGINGFACSASADIETFGVTDSLFASCRQWG